jgi:hypothetical protein
VETGASEGVIVGVQVVAGSNPVAPTFEALELLGVGGFFFAASLGRT